MQRTIITLLLCAAIITSMLAREILVAVILTILNLFIHLYYADRADKDRN